MKINIELKSRSNAYAAEAIYEDGIITVRVGSKIQMDFASHIKGGKIAKGYRENPEYVDKEGIVIKECIFSSPSTAAQFVTGRSTNGLTAWKVDKKTTLKEYLSNQ